MEQHTAVHVLTARLNFMNQIRGIRVEEEITFTYLIESLLPSAVLLETIEFLVDYITICVSFCFHAD